MNQQISNQSEIGKNTEIGHYTVIEADVSIGKNCQIGHHVVILQGSQIGNDVRIDDHTVIGKLPMRSVNSASGDIKELSSVLIKDKCIIGTSVILYKGCHLETEVLIADFASVRENVVIGHSTIIGRGVCIENNCEIGFLTKIETNAYITAYSKIGNNCFIAPCVATSNDNSISRGENRFKNFKGVTIKDAARIGVHATILPGKIIESESVVAAGALVTKDCEPEKIVAGLPAKFFKEVPKDQLLRNIKKK